MKAETSITTGTSYTLPFAAIRAAHLPTVGGKGANLGELTAAGLPVPPGLCVTTEAFGRFMACPAAAEVYALLDSLDSAQLKPLRQTGANIRTRLSQVPIPPEVAADLRSAFVALGAGHAYAVRSSATAEDLPGASFAGQQDTYLNVRGEQALLEHVRRCWVSLFTDRAILYRMQHGFAHRGVGIAVVVQRMVEPEVAGILFTADPISGHRRISSIDASFGLGEALVAGLVSADLYQVDTAEQRIIRRQIAEKQLMIRALPDGGVEQIALSGDQRRRPALSDGQVLDLARLGTRIEAHYGQPQDIEWALAGEQIWVLQARPITSLYPIPAPPPDDEALHAYVSFNHFQVMTDAMPELTLSLWRTIFPFGRRAGELENPLMLPAGGRLYIDVSPLLRHPLLGRMLPKVMSMADQLAVQALAQISATPSFQRGGGVATMRGVGRWLLPVVRGFIANLLWRRPEGAAAAKTAAIYELAAETKVALAGQPTTEAKLATIVATLHDIFPRMLLAWAPYAMAGALAHALLRRLSAGFAVPADLVSLGRGLAGNVTTEMDLAVGDLADLVRAQPDVARHLRRRDLTPQQLIDTLASLANGPIFAKAWQQFMERYGVRAPSEIDPSRPRWSEEPGSLLQMVLGHAQHSQSGTHRSRQRQLMAEGDAAAQRLISGAAQGPLGWLRRPLAERLVRVARQLLPLREHPKFLLIQLIALFKSAALAAGDELAARHHLAQRDDVWLLSIPELLAAMREPGTLYAVDFASRRAAFEHSRRLTPPRVITSQGEIPLVKLAAGHAPANALVGSPVSAGVVEGIARVVRDPQTEMLSPGEILVAPFTDPGWTPLFVSAAGLVMEVGGLMTHGSVVAREYGIPAVVGVQDATSKIRSGQRIRVHGDGGYVEILESVGSRQGTGE